MHPSHGPSPGAPQSPSAPPYPTPSTTVQPNAPMQPTGSENGAHIGYPPPHLRPGTTFRVPEPVDWSTGLCQWYSDMPNCCLTCFCPCITFGQFSEIVDRGSSSCPVNGFIYAVLLAVLGCACMYSYVYRVRMRQQFNLKGSNCGDCCIHTWCELCALTQEFRELQIRGFDMNSGWHANAENQNAGATTVMPPMQSGMRR